ncbi:hypothetical protein Goari_001508, partial [Gossypium aridum]|nr:hypothetical protein [Gossypium aridum]
MVALGRNVPIGLRIYDVPHKMIEMEILQDSVDVEIRLHDSRTHLVSVYERIRTHHMRTPICELCRLWVDPNR